MLLSNMELLATAPGGVAKLRELILTLAVQGKLVPQDPADEPAGVLLQKIRAEKDRLIAEGKIKRDKPVAEIAEEEKPFELPMGWEWVRLAELAYPQAGFAFKSNGFNDVGLGLPLIRIRDVGDNKPATFFSGEFRPEFVVEPGDWLISMDGEFRVREWHGPTSLLNQRVTRLIFCGDELFRPFVATALQFRLQELQGTKAYTTVDHLSGGQIASAVVPVPPLAEQSRIVTRVEALMRLCDALEARGQLEAAQHAQLVSTLLGTLTTSTTPEELADNWQRVAQHFDLLLDRPEAIDALEQTLLQLAVRGLLAPQDPIDEPASALLQKIRAEKDRLIATGQIKRDKPLPPITDEEKPFELPVGWEWVTVADVCSVVTDGEHATPERCDDPSQVPLVTAKNVRSETMDYSVTDYVPRPVAEQCWKRCKPEVGDVLMVSVGATLGRLSVLRDAAEMVLVRSVTVLRPVHVGLDVSYFALHLMSPQTQKEIWGSVKQSAQPCLYLAKSSALKVALPPLAEQSRIVTRVTALRRLCADLRQRLAERQSVQARLAEALVTSVA